jgi:hypothetical protein
MMWSSNGTPKPADNRTMKTRLPLSVTHPALFKARQEHLASHDATAGVILAAIIGAPLLAFLGGFCLFLIFGLS